MHAEEREKLITAWIQYHDPMTTTKNLFWAYQKLRDMIYFEGHEYVWGIAMDIFKRTDSTAVLEALGAGIVEDIITTHEEMYYDRVSKLAKDNNKFRTLLAGVNIYSDMHEQMAVLIERCRSNVCP
ncbi:DUF6869 domain-containing protein [Flagellimonas sp. 2504JD4-2]